VVFHSFVQLKMYRKCTVPVVASKGKYGSYTQGTWFQSPNQPLTLNLGSSLMEWA